MLFTLIALTLSFINTSEIATQKDSLLYIEYNKRDENVVRTWRGQPPSSYIYDYQMIYKGVDYKPIRFIEPDIARADTISIEKIKSWDIKSHKWLKNYFLEYFNYFQEENPYVNDDGTCRFFGIEKVDKIVIVEIEREKNRALLHYVVHDKY